MVKMDKKPGKKEMGKKNRGKNGASLGITALPFGTGPKENKTPLH